MSDGTRIGEAAARCGVSPDTLRYYERIGLLEPPARDASGRRLYSDRGLAVMEVIRALRGAGFSIDEIRRVVGAKRPGAGAAANAERVAAELDGLLAEVRERRRSLDRAARLLERWLDELRDAG